MALQCPQCGVAVEDEGLCVECWDREVEVEEGERIAEQQRAYREANQERKQQA